MDTVPDIIERLGGSTAIANDTGIPLTTVHTWKRKGYVPAWRIPTLVDLARRKGEALSEADFPSTRPTERAA